MSLVSGMRSLLGSLGATHLSVNVTAQFGHKVARPLAIVGRFPLKVSDPLARLLLGCRDAGCCDLLGALLDVRVEVRRRLGQPPSHLSEGVLPGSCAVGGSDEGSEVLRQRRFLFSHRWCGFGEGATVQDGPAAPELPFQRALELRERTGAVPVRTRTLDCLDPIDREVTARSNLELGPSASVAPGTYRRSEAPPRLFAADIGFRLVVGQERVDAASVPLQCVLDAGRAQRADRAGAGSDLSEGLTVDARPRRHLIPGES
jgi:hypothetical protein